MQHRTKLGRANTPNGGFRPGHTCKLPPSPQISMTQLQTMQLLSHFHNQYQQSSFLRRANLLHKSKVIWIFSLPSQSPLRLHSSILVLIQKPARGQANPTQNQQRQDHPLSPEMEEALSSSHRNKAVTSIRPLYLNKDNFSWTKGDLSTILPRSFS